MRGLFLLIACCLALAPLRAAPSVVDIVVVSNEADPGIRQLGKDIWNNLRTSRDVNAGAVHIPIDYYDYNRSGHRVAIQRLGIPTTKLPYVGLCQLDKPGGNPRKLLDGQGPVHDTVEAGMALQLCISDLFALSHAGQAADRQAIAGLYQIYSTALTHGQPHFLFEIIAPQYVFEGKDGSRIGRDELVQRLQQLAGSYQSDDVQIDNVQFMGDRALVQQTETSVRSGSTQTTNQVDLWVRSPRGWRIAGTKEQ